MLASSLAAPVLSRSVFQLFLHNGFDMFAAKRVADELLGLSRLGMGHQNDSKGALDSSDLVPSDIRPSFPALFRLDIPDGRSTVQPGLICFETWFNVS